MPLPTSTTGFAPDRASGVAQDDELWRLVRSACDRKQGVHAQLFHVGAVKDVDAQSMQFRELPSLVGKIGRRADISRQIAEVLRQFHAGTHRQALCKSQFGGGKFVAACDAECQFAQRTRRTASFFDLRRSNRYKASCATSAACRIFQDTSRFLTASSVRKTVPSKPPVSLSWRTAVATAARYSFSRNSLSLPSPTSRTRSASIPETPWSKQAGTSFAFHVAATKDIAEKLLGALSIVSAAADSFLGLEDADHDAGAALLFRASAFYAKFQNILLPALEIHESIMFRAISVAVGHYSPSFLQMSKRTFR
jgi:hypothetical protein